VVATKNFGGGGERSVFAQDGVGGGDGGIGDGDGVMDVAEVYDGSNEAGLRRDQGVVVVGVAIDDAAAKMREGGNGFLFEEI